LAGKGGRHKHQQLEDDHGHGADQPRQQRHPEVGDEPLHGLGEDEDEGRAAVLGGLFEELQDLLGEGERSAGGDDQGGACHD
jgi:hypothetical protein